MRGSQFPEVPGPPGRCARPLQTLKRLEVLSSASLTQLPYKQIAVVNAYQELHADVEKCRISFQLLHRG